MPVVCPKQNPQLHKLFLKNGEFVEKWPPSNLNHSQPPL
jgi:hypothetical protein